MALALAYEEAKRNQGRVEGDGKNATRGVLVTPFFGSRANPDPDLPHAHLGQPDAGRFNRAHFHATAQFQVIVDGKGKLGRHDLAPYVIHFARAHTPYGPLVPDMAHPFTLFTLRAHYDPGSQRLPKELDRLKKVPDRKPWQISRKVTFPMPPSGTAAEDVILQAVPGMKDEQGLAAYTLSMKPNAKAQAPDPSHGDGQYLVVLKGSLLHDNKEHKAWALVFVFPKEDPFEIHAGAGGLEALVLNFPSLQTRAAGATTGARAAPGLKTWQCALCGFVYDEAAGLPDEGIAPGTRWQDVPETWNCPDCSASKSDFQMVEV